MHPAFEASPCTHEYTPHHTTNCSRRKDQPEAGTVISCTQQHHWSNRSKGDPKTQVAKEEHQLQTKQARTGKNITESKRCLLQNTSLRLRAFLRTRRLWDMHKSQHNNCRYKYDHI